MTEAGWTRATDVTQPGWYWLRRVGSLTVVQVIAVPGYEPKHWIVEGVNLRWSLGNMDGEFLGPITPDSYQQGRVEGLREAAGMVDDDCYIDGGELLPDFEHRCKHNVNQKELAGKIRFRANALAQAAQDEKGVGDAGR